MPKDKNIKKEEEVLPKNDVVTPTKTEKEETITIPKSQLEAILQRIDDVEKKSKEEIEVLRKAADRGRLERIDSQRAQNKLVKGVNLSRLDGKIIVGWRRLVDEVYFDQDGRLHEDQKIELTFIDKTTATTTDRDLSRRKQLVQGEVISESRDMEGNINLKVMLSDGQEVEIDQVFIN
jgi:hypothetical protein